MSALANGDNLGLSYYSKLQNYREAWNSPHWLSWKAAMDSEIESLLHNETWVLVLRPESRFVISGHWVFKIKYGLDGHIIKYKARWVVYGYKQQEGVDYNKTWAGVVKPSSFRLLFAIVAEQGLHIEQMDVVTAFFYSFLNEDIFVNQPEGYVIDAALVCHLQKALYGLKQALRVCVFVSCNKSMFILVYVDDLLIIGEDLNIINGLKNKLLERFRMTDLGSVSHYLGMSVTRTRDSVGLDQKSYLEKVLLRFGMDTCKPASSPMDPGVPNSMLPAPENQQADKDTIFWYGSVVGSLMYAMTMTRPDLGYALSMVSRYCANPDSTHVAAVVRILRYVRGTLHYGLTYTKGQPGFVGYTDADWSGAIDGRQSTGGWLFMMGGAPISWSSKRQASVSQSSCESEYYALSEAGKEGVWLRLLLQELGHISAAPAII